VDIDKYKNYIYMGLSGLIIATSIVILLSKPQIKTYLYEVNTKELRKSQLQLHVTIAPNQRTR